MSNLGDMISELNDLMNRIEKEMRKGQYTQDELANLKTLIQSGVHRSLGMPMQDTMGLFNQNVISILNQNPPTNLSGSTPTYSERSIN